MREHRQYWEPFLVFVISLASSPLGAALSLCVSLFICTQCVFCNICVWCLSVHMCMHCVADYKRGFGGRYGVEVERQDQCALGYEHKESLAKHESQKGTDTSLNTSPNPTFHFTKLLMIFPFLIKVLPLSFFGHQPPAPHSPPQLHTLPPVQRWLRLMFFVYFTVNKSIIIPTVGLHVFWGGFL